MKKCTGMQLQEITGGYTRKHIFLAIRVDISSISVHLLVLHVQITVSIINFPFEAGSTCVIILQKYVNTWQRY